MVDVEALETKFPACFTFKPTNLTQSHLANSDELHLTLNTVLVPVANQVKLGFGSWFLTSWGTVESKWLDMSDLSTST